MAGLAVYLNTTEKTSDLRTFLLGTKRVVCLSLVSFFIHLLCLRALIEESLLYYNRSEPDLYLAYNAGYGLISSQLGQSFQQPLIYSYWRSR